MEMPGTDMTAMLESKGSQKLLISGSAYFTHHQGT